MDSKDKNSLIFVGYGVALIALFLFVTKLSDTINALYILIAFLAAQQIYRIPKLVSYYYEMKGSEVGFERFIPIYNETLLMSKLYSTVYIVCSVGIALCVGGIYLLPKVAKDFTFDGLSSILLTTDRLIYCAIFLVILLSFFRGLAYVELIKDVYYTNAEIMDQDETKLGICGRITYLLVFVPILRLLGILYLDNILQIVVDFVGYTEGDDDEEVYEEY